MPHRTFDVPDEPDGREPITFDMAGRKFECLPATPVAARLLVARATVMKADLPRFVEMVLADDAQVDAWQEVLAARRPIVRLEQVEEVFWWLIEEYAAREDAPPLVTRAAEPGE